ncbi:MAG TPA: hypothetical protein VM511_02100 [Luteolibacter sp.]|nr:hypothetical protein [Luteolibacter sp.]
MKNLILVGTLMLGLGFAIGWVSKPVPEVASTKGLATPASSKSPATAKTEEPAASVADAKRSDREKPAPKKNPGGITDEQMAQAKKAQAEMAKQMIKRYRTTLEQHIEKLSKNLNLTDAQRASLQSWLDERMAKLETTDFSDEKSMATLMQGGKDLTVKALEESLGASLSADQKTALTAFQEKEHQTKVDAAALKSLSKLQGVIEFEDGQRDEIYKLLSEGADADLRKKKDIHDPSAMFTESMGMDMDPYGLGLQELMTEAAGGFDKLAAGEAPTDEKDMKQRMREAVDKRIEQKVDLLRPVLNDTQLDRYRQELKTKGLGFYAGFLGGD